MRMYLLTFHCVLFVIYFFLPGVQSLRWLGIKNPLSGGWNRTVCQSYQRHSKDKVLDRSQSKLCRRRLSYMKYVAEAVQLTISECLKRAKYEKWDCSSILKAPKFSPDLREGTRESAFLHALSTAALVFTITQRCTGDNLKKCSCGKKPEKRHRRVKKGDIKTTWAECHDNIAFGIRFSKDFLDPREVIVKHPSKSQVVSLKHASKMMMNLHNNDAGRKAVRDSLEVECRCHGVTGTCPHKTCTRQLPISFDSIAANLFRRYKRARQVQLENGNEQRRFVPKSKKKQNNGNNKKSAKKIKPIDAKEIIYLVRSRNFCNKDTKRNLPGTEKRECRHTSSDPKLYAVDACHYLCCGRGHITKKISKTVDCRCKFVWEQMDVVCKKCSIPGEVSTCR